MTFAVFRLRTKWLRIEACDRSPHRYEASPINGIVISRATTTEALTDCNDDGPTQSRV